MATMHAGDIADLVNVTLGSLDRKKWTDMSTDLQEFHALPNILKADKVKTQGGNKIKVNIMTGNNGQARFLGLHEIDNYAFNDVMANGSIDWTHWTTNYVIDRREVEMNEGDEYQIVDLVKTRRAAALMAQAELLETAFWSKPATSADTNTMWGYANYIVKNATTGFNGGNPTGYTTGCIFDSTVQLRWLNYTAQHTNVTKTDAIRKMRAATVKTQFKSPLNMSEVRNGKLQRAIYTNYTNVAAVEELAEAQNENLGNDIASMDGSAYFRKVPFIYVPKLDSDTQNPFIGIDWATFYPVFLKGEQFKEDPARQHPTVHTDTVCDIDSTSNLLCVDRRKQWIVATA